jgi:hypothetical protein
VVTGPVKVPAKAGPALRQLVRDAIETHIDQDALRLTKNVEASEREVLPRIADGWGGDAA